MSQTGQLKHFLLVGSFPYENRGNEAIIRGTMAILRKEFGEDFRVTIASFGRREAIREQAARETDPLIRHIPLSPTDEKRWSRLWWRRHLFGNANPVYWHDLDLAAKDAACAFEIGGDLYTLDYGLPRRQMAMDNRLQARGIPVVLWGASVGPFDADPPFARSMFAHLMKLQAIGVREQRSLHYLQQNNVTENVFIMADPAFAMDPVRPQDSKLGCNFSEGMVGVNFSPLLANYVTKGDQQLWLQRCVELVHAIRSATSLPVLLIPHVTSPSSDDHALLERVAAAAGGCACAGSSLTAPETKWIISKCCMFAGARTHATIAAMSMGVPTLSFAYSAKALGLNQDMFGSLDYCIPAPELTSEAVEQRMRSLMINAAAIRLNLSQAGAAMRNKAFQSGRMIQHILAGQA
jgi:colanic acid/amylovoran biosynthesis protein